MSWEVVSCWIEGHPGLASWVQAFGSIAAILIAVWVSSADSRARKKAEKNARKSALIRCKWVLANAGDVVEKITKSLTGCALTDSLAIGYVGRLGTLHDEIRELAYGPGMESDIFGVVLGARLGVDQLRHKLQEWLDASDKISFNNESLRSHFSSIDYAIAALEKMEDAVFLTLK
jgi:hypothetical protein